MTGTGTPQNLPVVVLISGHGSNLQAIIEAVAAGRLPIEIRAVISNRPDARGLELAQAAGITALTVDSRHYRDRGTFDRALREQIDRFQPELLALAGFMRILTAEFVHHYRGRMLNIHPALLPAFPGLDTHERALKAQAREHGASVHFVTAEVDGGPVIVRARVPVLASDDAQSLAARVLEREHLIYPLAIRWFAQGRLRLDGECATLDGKPLPQTGVDYSEGRGADTASVR